MNSKDNRLEDIHIQSPCSASWSAMQGGDKGRHCESCDLKVHNLAAMSRAEGESLLANRDAEARLCVRMEFHPDGTCVTADRPQPVPDKKVRPSRSVAAALALGAGLLAACTGDKSRNEVPDGNANLSVDGAQTDPDIQRTVLGEANVVHPTKEGSEGEVTPEMLQQLEMLGYVSGPSDSSSEDSSDPSCEDSGEDGSSSWSQPLDPPTQRLGKIAAPRKIMGSPGPPEKKQ